MMRRIIAGVVLLILGQVAAANAELDLDQEVLDIPDTHNEKPYIWQVERNPRGYEFVLSEDGGQVGTYDFSITAPSGARPEDVHVFITNYDLHAYAHQRAERIGDRFRFTYEPPGPGTYRIEVVFQSPTGWVNLRRDVTITAASSKAGTEKLPGDEDYEVRLKLIPKKAYAEHVVTLLAEILYKGRPLKGLEKMDGFDMQASAWDEDLREFIYAAPKQNLGGPEVAVSFVFMRPGRHAVFAEFKHKGVVRRIETVLMVNQEFVHTKGAVENLRPAD